MRTKVFALLAVALTFEPQNASAICFEPSPPTAPFTSAPSAPFCSVQGHGFSRCSNFDINNYKSELEGHIQRMKDFVQEAMEFANLAQDYAVCEINSASDEWETFLNQ